MHGTAPYNVQHTHFGFVFIIRWKLLFSVCSRIVTRICKKNVLINNGDQHMGPEDGSGDLCNASVLLPLVCEKEPLISGSLRTL